MSPAENIGPRPLPPSAAPWPERWISGGAALGVVGAEKAIGRDWDSAAEIVAWAIAPEPGHWTAKPVWHEPQVMRSRTGASPGEEKRSRVPH
jgi:hypothetical protein